MTLDELVRAGFNPDDYIGRPGPSGVLALPSDPAGKQAALRAARRRSPCVVCGTGFALSSVLPGRSSRVFVCGYCRAAARRLLAERPEGGDVTEGGGT